MLRILGGAHINLAKRHMAQDSCCISLVRSASQGCDSAAFIWDGNVNVWATRWELQEQFSVQQAYELEAATVCKSLSKFNPDFTPSWGCSPLP